MLSGSILLKFRNNIRLLSFLSFIITLVSILCLSGCGKSVLNQTTEALNRSLPDESSFNVSIYVYKENKIDYVLTADKIERYYSLRKLDAWKVKIVAYDINKQIKSTIVADTAYVDEARNYVSAHGNVVFDTPNGVIKSRVVNWDRNYDEIYVPEKVTLLRDGNTLYGDNLRTDSNISFVEMTTVSAEGTVKGDELDW